MSSNVHSSELVLSSARLALRRIEMKDCDALLQVWGDPIAMRFYPKPLDRAGVEDLIRKVQERYATDGYALWVLLLKTTGEVIGDCGLISQEVDGARRLEVSYHVRAASQGNGYATEGARACMEYAFHELRAPEVISMIRPENIPSRRVAEKNGMQVEKTLFWHGYQHDIWRKGRG